MWLCAMLLLQIDKFCTKNNVIFDKNTTNERKSHDFFR